jgi:hypothetical protein
VIGDFGIGDRLTVFLADRLLGATLEIKYGTLFLGEDQWHLD